MRIDLGDVVAVVELRVPGLVRHRAVRHYGAPRKRSAADRGQRSPASSTSACRYDRPQIGVIMDLKADQEVDVSADWTDEVGNPAPAPADAQVTWETDNPTT